jgi:hypothetical protein
MMRIGGAVVTLPLPPKPDRRISRIRLSSQRTQDRLAQSQVPGRWEGTAQPRRPFSPAHPYGTARAVNSLWPRRGVPPLRGAPPFGTTSALFGWVTALFTGHLPTSLRSTVVTRFLATTDALTPAGPWIVAHRGSLIYCSRTSDHAVSNHLWPASSRHPLPRRCRSYFVPGFAFSTQARPSHRPNRVHEGWHPSYGLVVRFPLLSTRGYRPDAVTFSYWLFSVGQVGDFHPAVKERSQAHVEPGFPARRNQPQRFCRRAHSPRHSGRQDASPRRQPGWLPLLSWCVRPGTTARPESLP